VDRVVGLDGVRAEIAVVQTPDGHGRLELTKFHTPSNQDDNRHAPANTPGIRHVAFAVEDIDAVVADLRARGAELVGELERYEDSYRLCYVRGPEGSSSNWRSRSANGPSRPTCDQPERSDSRSARGSSCGR
jgi:4-hydroxyphenylpyruvate dioxygenase-like putative hemolysin